MQLPALVDELICLCSLFFLMREATASLRVILTRSFVLQLVRSRYLLRTNVHLWCCVQCDRWKQRTFALPLCVHTCVRGLIPRAQAVPPKHLCAGNSKTRNANSKLLVTLPWSSYVPGRDPAATPTTSYSTASATATPPATSAVAEQLGQSTCCPSRDCSGGEQCA